MKKITPLYVLALAACAAILPPSAFSQKEVEIGALGLISDYRSVTVSGPSGATGKAGPGLGFSGGFVLGQNMSNRWGGEFRYLYFRNDLELSSGGQDASLGAQSHAVHYDVLATLAEVAKAPAVASDGISFLPTLLGKNRQQKKHEYLYWEYPEKGGQLAIRMGKWKGVKLDMKKNKAARWELYDLEKDESETTDLANQYPAIVARFDQIVKKEHQPSHVPGWEFVE